MSLIGQTFPNYGNKDSVGVLRDIDLALGVGYEHPELGKLFRDIRERVIGLLDTNPDKGSELRNTIFKAKDVIARKTDPASIIQDRKNMQGLDHSHFEYHRLLLFRQEMLRNPKETLTQLSSIISSTLDSYGLQPQGIQNISDFVSQTNDESFQSTLENIQKSYGHLGGIAYCEGLINRGICLNLVSEFAHEQRLKYEANKKDSMEYWDYTNIINITEARKKINSGELDQEGKSFVLSGGAGNGFVQLGVIHEFVKNGGKIKSISGTSMGATMAVMIGMIGNDSDKIAELMQDIIDANMDGSMPEKLKGNESKMLDVFHKLRDKFGINDTTTFNDLKIPVVINAGRQYNRGEQEVILSGNELVIPSIYASMNVPFLHKNNNIGAIGKTPIHGVNLIDYATNERGNPTHILELLDIQQKDMITIDVGYSSERGGSPFVRRLYQRATIRDFFAKLRIKQNNGIVIDAPVKSYEGYRFPKGSIERFFKIGKEEYTRIREQKE
ncbi:patatin-like phospholipase family protein [Candidatus Gracilibacteria bacterium]|nr:patatin-like phospholipase family protein [Candidatus Gracilibacteria bacterium]